MTASDHSHPRPARAGPFQLAAMTRYCMFTTGQRASAEPGWHPQHMDASRAVGQFRSHHAGRMSPGRVAGRGWPSADRLAVTQPRGTALLVLLAVGLAVAGVNPMPLLVGFVPFTVVHGVRRYGWRILSVYT